MEETLIQKEGFIDGIKATLHQYIGFFILVLTFTRFFFATGYVTSGSMEPTIKTGDITVKNVCIYGGTTPSQIRMPILPRKVRGWSTVFHYIELPVFRMLGYGEPKPGDCLTFKAPIALKTNAEGLPEDEGTDDEEYVKRFVADAGSKVKIENAMVYIDGQEDSYAVRRQYILDVSVNKPLSISFLDSGTEEWKKVSSKRNGETRYHLTMTYDQIRAYDRYRDKHGVYEINEKLEEGKRPFWEKNRDKVTYPINDMKEVVVPYTGYVLDLNKDTAFIHLETIKRESKRNGVLFRIQEDKDGGKVFYLNGRQVHTYTFKESYIFCLGDNFHKSADNRMFGFTPKKDIIAKVTHVIISLNGKGFWYRLLTLDLRWDRFGTPIYLIIVALFQAA